MAISIQSFVTDARSQHRPKNSQDRKTVPVAFVAFRPSPLRSGPRCIPFFPKLMLVGGEGLEVKPLDELLENSLVLSLFQSGDLQIQTLSADGVTLV